MKSIILARHTGKNDDRTIRYWEYTNKTNHLWNYNTSDYAIVETKAGFQLVEVLGTANVKDNFDVSRKVTSFLSNDEFKIEEE